MSQSFPKIEDIIEDLSTELSVRGFDRFIIPEDSEKLRYVKKDSSINFRVSVEENYEDKEEPQFNHIRVVVSYDLPVGMPVVISEAVGERIFPNYELMREFFRYTSIYNQSLCANEDRFKDRRMNLIYHIGFEKNKTSATGMKNVLREVIDYFCDYVTTNVKMLSKAQLL